MKPKCAAALASVLFLTLTGSALAADSAAKKPIVVSDKVTVKATVDAIDHTNRIVALKGPEGNIVELSADESVKRFDNLKIGDTVTAAYYESVAFDIKKPGGGVTDTTVTTVTIMAIDASVPAVTIKTSDGEIKNHRVMYPEYLKDIKVGDVVVVTKQKALMISVE